MAAFDQLDPPLIAGKTPAPRPTSRQFDKITTRVEIMKSVYASERTILCACDSFNFADASGLTSSSNIPKPTNPINATIICYNCNFIFDLSVTDCWENQRNSYLEYLHYLLRLFENVLLKFSRRNNRRLLLKFETNFENVYRKQGIDLNHIFEINFHCPCNFFIHSYNCSKLDQYRCDSHITVLV